MRPLTDAEMKVVLDKVRISLSRAPPSCAIPSRKQTDWLTPAQLANYMSDLKSLIAPLDDGDRYVFRLNHSRVRPLLSRAVSPSPSPDRH